MARPSTEDPDRPRDILDSPEAAHAVVRGGLWRVSSYVTGNVLAVVSAAVVVRYLGVRELARYTTVVALTAIVSGVFEAGLGNIGVREASVLHGAERTRLLRGLLGLRLIVAIAGVFVAVLIALALGYPTVMVAGAAVSSFGILVYTLQTHYATALQIELRLAQYSALDLGRQAALTAIAVVFVVLDLGLLPLLAAPVPANVIMLAATLWLVRGAMPLGAAFALRHWRTLVGRSFAFAAATATGIVYSQIAILLMSIVSTETQTGLFSASFRIFGVVAVIPGLLITSVLPILSRAARDDRGRFEGGLQRTFDVAVVVGATLSTLTIVGAPVAIAIVAGSGFDGSIDVLRIHGAAIAATSVIAFAGYGLMSVGAYRTILACNLVGLVVVASLAAVLGSAYGAIGAAVANLVGESVFALIYLIAITRQGVRLRWRAPLLAFAISAPIIALGLALPASPLVELVVAAALLAGWAWAFGLIPEELLASLRIPARARA